MLLKRGLIYLVFLLLIPIIYSQSLICDDGTRFASCKENTNLFCSDRNLILNGGFEADSNQDGIPNLFSKDPYANIGTDLIYSTDALSGLKSILIRKQWASFDYQAPFGGAIVLQPSTDYLFFAFVKGNCQNLRVFYSQQQTGTANELCGSNKICTLIPFGSEWKRLITQFNSNEIQTTITQGDPNGTVSQGSTQVPFLSNLRVECADQTPINSTSFRLYVDNMHLQPVDAPPQLIENCQICGSCPRGLFCTPDGSCVNDLSAFYTDEELLKASVISSDLEGINSLQETAYKRVGLETLAVKDKDLDLCTTTNCVQQVFDFGCSSSSDTACKLSILSSSSKVNPNFDNGRDIYRKGNQDLNIIYSRDVSLRRNGDSFARNSLYCDVKHEVDRSAWYNFWGETQDTYRRDYEYGTILRNEEFIQTISDNYGGHLICIFKGIGRLASGDCRHPFSDNDLLCGYDDYWYLCNEEGFKTFDNGKIYYCTGEGRWIEI